MRSLHNLLIHPAIGHKFSRLYKCAREIYDEQKQIAIQEGRPEDIENFRIRLLDRSEVERKGMLVQNDIHPLRILTPEEFENYAQVN